MNRRYSFLLITLSLVILSSCSLVGIQKEESPRYKVLVKDGDYEIRKYNSYIIAQVTTQGEYEKSSKEAFRILAGYIFGKNQSKKEIEMTSPVKLKSEPVRISMTSPVTIKNQGESNTMSFSMPAKYSIKNLPSPLDKRIKFLSVTPKVVAVNRYTWLSSKSRNAKKATDLLAWLSKYNYTYSEDFIYAGYNPPWTIPFFKRHEVQIELETKD